MQEATFIHSYNINTTDWNNWCFSQMRIPDKARVLELGCGTGDLWYKNKENLKNDWSITLSDFSMGMLNNTKKRLENINFNFTYKEINAQDIPYENECFDTIIARHMLYLVPDIEKALSEIKRILVKDGTLYITTNSRDTMAELNALVEKFDSKMGLHNNGMGVRWLYIDSTPPYLHVKYGGLLCSTLYSHIINFQLYFIFHPYTQFFQY